MKRIASSQIAKLKEMGGKEGAMDLLATQWEKIKENIRKEYDITNIAYNIWVAPLLYFGCEDNVVSIRIPNGSPEMQAYIEKNYTEFFECALSELLQGKYKVRFVLDEEKEKKSTSVSLLEANSRRESYETGLDQKYRFENFVVGPTNSIAHSASMNVAEYPGDEANNPLFIYGGSGLGKTHLMTAIGNYLVEKKGLNVLYVTSEEFMNEVINSIRAGDNTKILKLREKYRTIDALLIDDIQFIIGKQATQEEFFHTFNTLYKNGKAVVITSDKHPAYMKELDERFRSRFGSGVMVDIQPPEYETRVAILRRFAENYDYEMPDEVFYYIAEHIKSNIRDLEGAYKNMRMANVKDLETAKAMLKDSVCLDRVNVITPEMILRGISEYYHLDRQDITSQKRSTEYVLPRQIFMYLCREMTEYTLKGIAVLLGKKDHSTVLHGYNKICEEIEKNKDFRGQIDAIKDMIKTY